MRKYLTFLVVATGLCVALSAQTRYTPPASSGGTTDASLLTTGTLPDGRFPATLPALNGSLLTSLNPANLSSYTFGVTSISGTTTPLTVVRNLTGSAGNAMVLGRKNSFGGGTPTNNDQVGFTWQLDDSANAAQNVASLQAISFVVTAGSMKTGMDIQTRTAADVGLISRLRVDDVGSTLMAGTSGNMNLVMSAPAPTIASGFGSGSSVTGHGWAFRITIGTTPGTTGTINFNVTFANPPVVYCSDESLQSAIQATPSNTQVVITYSASVLATQKLSCLVMGY